MILKHDVASATAQPLSDTILNSHPPTIPFFAPRKLKSLPLKEKGIRIPILYHPHKGLPGRCPFFIAVAPKAQRSRVTCPQPHSSDGAGRAQTRFSNPPHPMTLRCLPHDKSCPSHPVLQGHTSHFFRESPLGPSFSRKVRGATPLYSHA